MSEEHPSQSPDAHDTVRGTSSISSDYANGTNRAGSTDSVDSADDLSTSASRSSESCVKFGSRRSRPSGNTLLKTPTVPRASSGTTSSVSAGTLPSCRTSPKPSPRSQEEAGAGVAIIDAEK